MKSFKFFSAPIFKISFWGYFLFWSWNLIFLAFMFFGFAPNMLPQMVDAIRHEWIPLDFLITGIIVTLIPALAVILGLTVFRRSPLKLLALGYGVEGPLMALLLARIFLIRQPTPPILMIYAVGVVGVFVLLWQLLERNIEKRGKASALARLTGLTLLLLLGFYAALLIAFYAAPGIWSAPRFVGDVLRGLWDAITHLEWQTLVMFPMTFFGLLLLLFTATLFAIAPVAVPVLYFQNWRSGMRLAFQRLGKVFASVWVLVLSVAVVVGFVALNRQPQQQAYELLKAPPASLSEAEHLLQQAKTIRRGLLNAYLAPVRYLSAVGEVEHISFIYQDAFGLSEDAAWKVQDAFEFLARPVFYNPMTPTDRKALQRDRWNQQALRAEPQEAAQLYEAFFDVPILQAERETIVKAVRNTWSGTQALAAWQAVDDREILLTHQEVRVEEHGDWAEVEIFEAYQNQTATRQEAIYYFSLPETAVLTGLWLGNSPDRADRYSYVVAPRGAAQQVYQEQVQMNIDPALLEQVGPRQYRLRVYPIEPQIWRWDETMRASTVEAGPTLYLWMTYRVLARGDHYPLPQLAEKINVYWDRTSQRQINGVAIAGETEAWFPEFVAATAPVTPRSHQVVFPSGEAVILRPAADLAQYPLPQNLRLAVVLDRSRSMVAVQDRLSESLDWLKREYADVDVYLTASAYRGESPSVARLADLTPSAVTYLGGQNPAELLAQFFALSGGRKYDALLVLTDGVGFKLGGQDVRFPVPEAPVWMIHVGGQFPMGYDDATLQAIQASGGGVAGSLEEALVRLGVYLEGKADQQGVIRDVVDGYEWWTVPATASQPQLENLETHTLDDPFAALATRRLILSEMQRQRGSIQNVETLDALHALAVEQGIVTPYSSMIVLVSQAQRNRLSQLENRADRFEREAEDIATTPTPFQVTGVPEPHEWLLIALAVGFLGWLAWQRKRQGRWVVR